MTSSVLATFEVGAGARWLAAAPDGSRVYVTVASTGTLAVIDTTTGTVIAQIPIGTVPGGVVVAPDGRRVYACGRRPGGGGAVTVIDPTLLSVVAMIAVGPTPTGIALTPNGRELYVASGADVVAGSDKGAVSVIDLGDGTASGGDAGRVVSTLEIDPFPATVSVTPDGRSVYAWDTESVPAVIDTATHTADFPFLSFEATRVAFSPDGTVGYGIRDSEPQVYVLDPATNKLINMLDATGQLATDVAFSPDGRFVYFAIRATPGLTRLAVGEVAGAHQVLDLHASANGIVILPDGCSAYLSDSSKGVVRVVSIDPEPAA